MRTRIFLSPQKSVPRAQLLPGTAARCSAQAARGPSARHARLSLAAAGALLRPHPGRRPRGPAAARAGRREADTLPQATVLFSKESIYPKFAFPRRRRALPCRRSSTEFAT